MWKSKKFIVITILAVVVLVGSIAGVAFAQTGSTGTASSNNTLLARVAAILNINQQDLQNAFTQAQKEMRNEALDSYLNKQVAAGKITADDAAKYKAWLDSKPNVPLPGAGGSPAFGMHRFPGGMGCGGHNFFFKGAPAPTTPAPTQ